MHCACFPCIMLNMAHLIGPNVLDRPLLPFLEADIWSCSQTVFRPDAAVEN